ncbi:H+ Antiporter protein [compost metagenome]
MFLAARQNVGGMPRLILLSAITNAIALLAFAASRELSLSLLAMAVLGFGVTINNVGTNIVLQGQAPEELRGRVVSLYTSTRFGFDAIGGLLAGLIAARFGGPWAMALAGGLLLAYCLWLGTRPTPLPLADGNSQPSA